MAKVTDSVSGSVRAPAAMLELIRRYFGFGALPDYSATLAVMDRDPYRPVREEFATKAGPLLDVTDYNSDLGFVYVLTGLSGPVTVRLSAVGPYAVVTDEGEVADVPDVADLLRSAGFLLLDQALLELPVDVWAPEVTGTVYEFLFEFDEGLPWAR